MKARSRMTSQGNRGMALEQLINLSNATYRNRELAVVYKRPTPVKILRTQGLKILSAVLESPSTVDYEGVYRGRSLQFEAKSTRQTTRFDFDNVHPHQIEHIRECMKQSAICFVILEFSQLGQIFYLPGKMLLEAWDRGAAGGRKSIPYDDIATMCYQVKSTRGIVLDYLAVVDELLAQTV